MIRRDVLDRYPEYAEAQQAPREDLPRLALAAAIEAEHPERARYIRLVLELAQLECKALVDGTAVDARFEQGQTVREEIAKSHVRGWRTPGDGLVVGFNRGLGEYVKLDVSTPVNDIDAVFAAYPIQHVHLSWTPRIHLPTYLTSRLHGLASVWLTGADDAVVDALVAEAHLRSLKRLTLRGPMTQRALDSLCEASLPWLEELEFSSGLVKNPCDVAASDNWSDLNPRAYAIASYTGAELEARFGYKKFLHAASRFSVYPCSLDALDILPPLPAERLVRPREQGRV